MTDVAWLIPALPFAAAVLGLLVGPRLPGGPAGIAIVGTAVPSLLSVALLAQTGTGTVAERVTLLTPTGGLGIFVGTRVDPLAAVVTVMVCAVALAVQVYSVAYMRGDSRYSSYAAEVSLFTAAMLTVVLAADLFMLLVGWEVMGVCSYLLIGHYWQTPSASAAAVKAFLTTRVGDVGFLFGIFTLGLGAGSFRIGTVLDAELSRTTLTVGTLLLVCGVVGKSAQFPLHTWLPDAMAGPTPISALIHAATMVAAGVYVVARLYPAFTAAPYTMPVLAVIAAVTMLLAALAALAQDDLKRVLAYSTVSQLAYMVGGLAVHAPLPAVFHLLTHAAFKALLFLCAGAVIRTVGTNLMSEMGGLRRGLPITFVTMTIGLAALAGLPPFAGFVSKDAVLGAAYEAAHHGDGSGWLVLVVGMATVVVTAAYATRAWLLTFFGRLRTAVEAHEAPPLMSVPLVLLAVPAALLGLLAVTADFAGWLGLPGPHATPELGTALVSVVLALGGVALVLAAWRRAPARDPVALLATPVRRAFDRAFYFDDAYDAVFVRPLPRLARAVLVTDERGVDGAVNGSGVAARALGGGVRMLQNGNVQLYATALFAGVVALALAVAVLA